MKLRTSSENAISAPKPNIFQVFITFLVAIISFLSFKRNNNIVQIATKEATTIDSVKEVVNNNILTITPSIQTTDHNSAFLEMRPGVISEEMRALSSNSVLTRREAFVNGRLESLQVNLFNENKNQKTIIVISCRMIKSQVSFNLTALSSTTILSAGSRKSSAMVVGMVTGIMGGQYFQKGLPIFCLIQSQPQQKLITPRAGKVVEIEEVSEILQIKDVKEGISSIATDVTMAPEVTEITRTLKPKKKVRFQLLNETDKQKKEVKESEETSKITRPQNTKNIQGFGLGVAVVGIRGIVTPLTIRAAFQTSQGLQR